MSRENDSVIFKLLKSADVINDDTQEISQQFDGESYPKLPEVNMLELGEIALNIAKDYEVIAIKNNEGEIVYIPFNVAIRLLTLEGDVADLAQYTEESVETLSAATVSIYNNLEEFKVEISNRLVQEITSLSGNVFTTIDSLSATTDAKIAAEKERAVSAETALNTALSNLSNHLDDIIPSDTDISNKLTNKGYVDSEIKKITDVIPNDTSSGNPLTNEAFVNSSISTSTATFRGTYNLITDLHLTSAATTSEIAAAVGEVVLVCDKNDYAYVQIPTSETATTEILRIERYKYDGTAWGFEYALNNSGFTAKQWAAINSGIVAGLVMKLEDLPNKAELDALFDAKQDKLTFDNTPRYGSNNPVTSGGIKGAVDERLPLSGGTVTGDLILNIGYGTNVSLKANSNRNFLRFNDSYNGYIIGDGNVRLALETGNVDLKHRYTTSSGATDYVIVDTRNIQENLTPNLKTLNGTPIVGSGDIDIKDVYLAMYRVTPYSSIMEAYWRGKVILVMGFDGIVYFLSKITVSEALFTHFDQTTMTVSSFTVNTSNVYSDITSQQLQENLVSGENIKTINNNSILGDGNIALQVPIDSSNKLDADYVDDRSSLHKFVSTEEKAKWDAKLPLSGGTMTGDLDLNGNALLVRKSGDKIRNGIRFTGEGVREGIYVGNPNMRLILEADPNLDLIHKKGNGFYDILDTNNVATKGNIYQTTWGDILDNIINAANAGKIVILKRDITYNEQKYSPTYVLNCFIKRVSDDYITEAHFYATLEDNVVAEIACKRGPTWVDNGVIQLQENLVSGTNIKTINGNSVLGSGNIDTQEVFVGQYGQTSYEDIGLACHNYKSIWMQTSSNPENKFALSCNLGSGNGGFVFYRIKPEQIEWFVLDELAGYSRIYSLDLQSKLTFDNTPTSGSTNPVTSDGIKTALDNKQDALVSGTNIKTINNQSVLGSGNLDVKDVFIAEYDVTNPQDVFDAIEEGKLVIVKKSGVYYQPEQWLTETSIRFVGFGYLNNFNFFDLDSTTWGTIFSYKWQRADEKVSTITGNIDNIKYPTTKAVTDYAQPIIDSSNKLSADLVDDSSTTHKFVTANEKESWDNKIDKVTSATTGNFANFDSNGGIVDSGKKDSDFATAAQGSLADSAYQKPLDGIPASDIASGVIPDVSQFVTRSVNDLLNYYTKQNTYTKQEVRDLIGSIQHFHYEIYASLQDITTPATNVLYLIGPSGSGNDKYEEYVYANSDFQKIGDTSIDLSNYVTTQALNSALQQFAQDLQTELNNYALKSQIKTVNGNSLIGSGDVSIHPEIVILTETTPYSSGHYEDLMQTVGTVKLDTPQIFLYTAYSNNNATTAICFSTCTNTGIKQTLFLGTYKSIRTLSTTVENDKYPVVDTWAWILDVKQSDLDAKLSKSGGSMTGDLDLDGHALLVRKSGNQPRNGIKFENDATGVLVGNGNMNTTIQSGDADLKHRKGLAPSAVDCIILDSSNVKTFNNQSIYGSGNIDFAKYEDTLISTESPVFNDIEVLDASTTVYTNTTRYTLKPNQKIVLSDTVGTNKLYLIDATDENNKSILISKTSSVSWNNFTSSDIIIQLASESNSNQLLTVNTYWRGTDNVFVAKYGVTTYQQVLDAYNAGKILFANYAEMKFVNIGASTDNDNVTTFVFNLLGHGAETSVTVVGFTVSLDGGTTIYSNISTTDIQTLINANNKLSADLVDDSSTTHKFVTSAQTETWNTVTEKAPLPFVVTVSISPTGDVRSISHTISEINAAYSANKQLRLKCFNAQQNVWFEEDLTLININQSVGSYVYVSHTVTDEGTHYIITIYDDSGTTKARFETVDDKAYAKYNDVLINSITPTIVSSTVTIDDYTLYPSEETFVVKPYQKIAFSDTNGDCQLYIIDATNPSAKTVISYKNHLIIWDNQSDIDITIQVGINNEIPGTLNVSTYWRGIDDVFIAEYNVTSVSEIQNAVDSGRVVMCRAIESSNIVYYQLSQSSSTSFTFFRFVGARYYRITLNKSTGVWSTSDDYLQSTSNRDSSIDSSASTTHYPSTKAVYDYVQAQIGAINTILDTI